MTLFTSLESPQSFKNQIIASSFIHLSKRIFSIMSCSRGSLDILKRRKDIWYTRESWKLFNIMKRCEVLVFWRNTRTFSYHKTTEGLSIILKKREDF